MKFLFIIAVYFLLAVYGKHSPVMDFPWSNATDSKGNIVHFTVMPNPNVESPCPFNSSVCYCSIGCFDAGLSKSMIISPYKINGTEIGTEVEFERALPCNLDPSAQLIFICGENSEYNYNQSYVRWSDTKTNIFGDYCNYVIYITSKAACKKVHPTNTGSNSQAGTSDDIFSIPSPTAESSSSKISAFHILLGFAFIGVLATCCLCCCLLSRRRMQTRGGINYCNKDQYQKVAQSPQTISQVPQVVPQTNYNPFAQTPYYFYAQPQGVVQYLPQQAQQFFGVVPSANQNQIQQQKQEDLDEKFAIELQAKYDSEA